MAYFCAGKLPKKNILDHMSRLDLSGLGVALVTPLNEDGSVDYVALSALVEYQIEGEVDFLVALGTTGESATLSANEHRRVIETVAERVNGRLPLIVGVGDNCTARLVERLRALDTHGVDGILSVVPYYNKPTKRGIIAHFEAASEASPLPIILYNIPGRTGINMTPEITLELADRCHNIVAVKEASEDVNQVRELVNGSPEGFVVLSGDDHLSIPFIQAGAKGVISVVGNAYPRRFGELIRLALSGDYGRATELSRSFDELYLQLFANGNPAGIKCLLRRMGLIASDVLRLPLVALSEPEAARLVDEYARLGADR
ncbi:dihydrodipicolinate synthase [Porphyromonas crevioricanis JCM 13913]|nr:dihydrodipicolinate synthase [Porphyromonas crevioricanis JCM 13913]